MYLYRTRDNQLSQTILESTRQRSGYQRFRWVIDERDALLSSNLRKHFEPIAKHK